MGSNNRDKLETRLAFGKGQSEYEDGGKFPNGCTIQWTDDQGASFSSIRFTFSTVSPGTRLSMASLPPIPQSGPVFNHSGILELRINSPSVRLYPEPSPSISDDILAAVPMTAGANSPSSSEYICLLRGFLGDFVQYSRQEACKWLMDIAHDICDPTEQRGWLLVWNEQQQQWSPVSPTDTLSASMYRYDLPDGTTVGLSKISQRVGKSRTTYDQNASAMRDRVRRRDERCWISEDYDPRAANGHILPKRMGDHIARIIFRTFTSLPLPPNLSIYDDIFGFRISLNLNPLFDNYELGLRFVSPNNYECHSFRIANADEVETICGVFRRSGLSWAGISGLPALHGHPAAPLHPQSNNLPPAGLFRWHYLQCVLQRFAHDDYKNLENINLSELHLRMEGDSDDDGTDSEFEWPSKAFDLGRVVENDIREREERNQAVATWVETTK